MTPKTDMAMDRRVDPLENRSTARQVAEAARYAKNYKQFKTYRKTSRPNCKMKCKSPKWQMVQ